MSSGEGHSVMFSSGVVTSTWRFLSGVLKSASLLEGVSCRCTWEGDWGWNIAELANFSTGVLTSWKTTDGFGDAGGALSPEHRDSVPDRWA